MISDTLRVTAALGAVLGVAILFTFERPPIIGIQRGYRGTGIQQIYNPRRVLADAANNVVPAGLPQLNYGPLAGTVYKNVKVLGGVHVGEFTRLMASMTTWVAPKQGCAYCHSLNNMADDSLYTKVVARRMIQMVQHVNSSWTSHVQEAGVTCYTCHRGNPVPVNLWYANPRPDAAGGLLETNTGKNLAIGPDHSSLPYDSYTNFLESNQNIRVQGTTALPEGNLHSIKQTEWTYALMLHFSQSLGVNCTYCHNSRAFGDWSQSSPQRTTAWYGIRMVRDLNINYLDALHDVFPPVRLGPTGDAPKVNCATCHQGANKPLYGARMAVNYPELEAAVTPPVVPAAAVVPPAPPVATAPPATPPSAPAPGLPAPTDGTVPGSASPAPTPPAPTAPSPTPSSSTPPTLH